MNEIENLCNRMGIMANGQLQCIGTSEYLRNKYATGFTLNFRLNDSSVQNCSQVVFFKTVMKSKFPDSSLCDEHLVRFLDFGIRS